MQFRTLSLLFITAAGTIASPLAAFEDRDLSGSAVFEPRTEAVNWILLDSVERENGGRMEYYGINEIQEVDLPKPTRTVDLDRRETECSPSPTPSCDMYENQAQNALCTDLLDTLSAESAHAVDTNWRRICNKGESGSCCTSWNRAIPSLLKGNLTQGVQSISESCSSDGISGKIYGLRFYGTCYNQCLNSGHSCS